MFLWSESSEPQNTLGALAGLPWCLSVFPLLPSRCFANCCCQLGPQRPGGLCSGQPWCVQMFILGCATRGSGHPQIRCGCALALSQL